MRFETSRGRRAAINMTPLVDVVFLLLVFFLLTSSFMRHQTLELTLHEVVLRASDNGEANLIIRIDEFEEVTIHGRKVRAEMLRETLMEETRTGSYEVATILAEPAARLQLLVTVLDEVRRVGIADVRVSCAGE